MLLVGWRCCEVLGTEPQAYEHAKQALYPWTILLHLTMPFFFLRCCLLCPRQALNLLYSCVCYANATSNFKFYRMCFFGKNGDLKSLRSWKDCIIWKSRILAILCCYWRLYNRGRWWQLEREPRRVAWGPRGTPPVLPALFLEREKISGQLGLTFLLVPLTVHTCIKLRRKIHKTSTPTWVGHWYRPQKNMMLCPSPFTDTVSERLGLALLTVYSPLFTISMFQIFPS